jgi:hypothetical protein
LPICRLCIHDHPQGQQIERNGGGGESNHGPLPSCAWRRYERNATNNLRF